MVTVCLLAVSAAAEAKPEFLDVLTSTYKPYSQALTARGCANCHVSDSDFKMNPYGKELKLAMHAASAKTMTAAILQSVEPQASNPGDISNIDKIKQGLAPGAPKAAPPGATAAPAPKAEDKPTGLLALIPTNAMHPAVVHFPIALFIAGIFLDILGLVRKNKTLLTAGWYNLLMAAVTAFGGIASGLLAYWLLKLPLKGIVRTHLILAIVCTVIMWILIALRAGRHEQMSKTMRIAYYCIAAVGVLLIAYTGHIGGDIVAGN
jgi:uncharacterized membrane protein